MKEPDLEEEALSGRQLGRELTITRRTMADKAEAVAVTSPSGAATTVTLAEKTPGLWQGSIKVDEAGMYALNDGKLQAVAATAAGDAREAQDILQHLPNSHP